MFGLAWVPKDGLEQFEGASVPKSIWPLVDESSLVLEKKYFNSVNLWNNYFVPNSLINSYEF